MSYLAMSAALIDNENNQIQQYESPINKKRQNHNKTQKFRQSSSDFDQQKVNSVLQSIHNSTPDEDNELGNYSSKGSSVSAKHSDDFKPLNPFEFPSKPLSMGSERTKKVTFDYYMLPYIEIYFDAGAPEKAIDLIRTLTDRYVDDLGYYSSLSGKFKTYYGQNSEEALAVLQRLSAIAEQNKQTDLSKEIDEQFQKFINLMGYSGN